MSGYDSLRGLLLAILMLLPFSGIAESLESAVMPGKVIEGHAKYENECNNCHKRFDKDAQTNLCLDCHKKTAEDLRNRKGFHGRLKEKSAMNVIPNIGVGMPGLRNLTRLASSMMKRVIF